VVIISVLVLGEFPELLFGARQVVDPKKGLLLVVVSVPYHEDVTSKTMESKVIAK
jgi:hypothetical protein